MQQLIGESTIKGPWGKTTYDQWVDNEGVPVIRGLGVYDLNEVEVENWKSKGALGTFIKLEGSGLLNDAYVLEILPGQSTIPQKHFFEEMVYILTGSGTTDIWNNSGNKQAFTWKAGSLFSLPLNTFYQFHNNHGEEPARYLAITNAPLFLNLIHNMDFIMNCAYDFKDRFTEVTDYSGEGAFSSGVTGRTWETNFVPNVTNFELKKWEERGAGGSNIYFEIGNGSQGSHISEFPSGTYKKAHRHGPGAHVIILKGEGYSLMWEEGCEVYKVDWKPGSMLVPPDRWFHQHFNTGKEPARYLAIRTNSYKWPVFINPDKEDAAIKSSIKSGGDQIEYEEQDAAIHEQFVKDCVKQGVEVKIDAFSGA